MPKLISICFTVVYKHRYITFNFFPPLIPSYAFGLPSQIYIRLLLPTKRTEFGLQLELAQPVTSTQLGGSGCLCPTA